MGQRQLVLVDTLKEPLYDELTPEFPRASVAVTWHHLFCAGPKTR